MARKAPKPEFAVIGLGRFGISLALSLVANGYTVLGIDQDRATVQRLAEELTQTVALDATDEAALAEIDIASFDTVVVAIGDDFESSIMATVALKSLGVKRLVCKALTEQQRSILLKVGADRVVLPEHEAGRSLALSLVTPAMLEQLALGTEHSITVFQLPQALAGKAIRQYELSTRLGAHVLAVKRRTEIVPAPGQDFVLVGGDLLVILARNEHIDALAEITAAPA
jgi:trk system potassium uptake protein TrkA